MPSPAASVAKQDLHLGIVPEGLLRLHAFLAAHAAMDDDDGLRRARAASPIRPCR